MLTLNDGRSELWQWDTGRTLAVDADCSQVHFSNKVFGRSIDVDVAGGVAIVPDVLLQTDKDLNVWAFVGTAENGYTKISKTFKINRRNKPADYVFTQTDQMTLQTIQRQIGDLADLTTEAKDTLVAAINEAARTGGGAGSMDLRVAGGYVQYSRDGGMTWTNLIAMEDLKGDPGAPGADGKSAYQYAVEGGFTGTEAEFSARMAEEIPNVDSTLTESGQAADAAVVGNRLSALSEEKADKEYISLKKYGITAVDYEAPFTTEMYEVAYANGVGIQAAINDAIAAGKTRVILPPGNYPLCYHASADEEYNTVIDARGIDLYGYGAKLYIIYDEDGTNPYFTGETARLLMGTIIKTDRDVVGLEIVGERAYRSNENTKYRDSSCGIRLDTWTDGNTIKNCKIHHISGDGIGSGLTFESPYISGDIECVPGTITDGVITTDGAESLMSSRMGIGFNVDTNKPLIMCSTGYHYFLWTKKIPTIHCFDKDENYLGSLKNNQGEPFTAPEGTFYVYVELYMNNPDTTSYTAQFRFGNAKYCNTLINSCELYLNQRGGASNLPTGTVFRNCQIHDNGGAYGNMVAYHDATQFGVDQEDWYTHSLTFDNCVFWGNLFDILYRCNKLSVIDSVLTDTFKSLNYAVDVYLKSSKFYGEIYFVTSAEFGEKSAVNCYSAYGFPDEIKVIESYELPEAGPDVLGGVMVDNATEGDTQPVRKGSDGKLYTAPGAVAESYTLPQAGAELGGVKADAATEDDTQAVHIGTDGKLVTAPTTKQYISGGGGDLPVISESDEGKFLGVSGGQSAWIDKGAKKWTLVKSVTLEEDAANIYFALDDPAEEILVKCAPVSDDTHKSVTFFSSEDVAYGSNIFTFSNIMGASTAGCRFIAILRCYPGYATGNVYYNLYNYIVGNNNVITSSDAKFSGEPSVVGDAFTCFNMGCWASGKSGLFKSGTKVEVWTR